MMIICDHGYFRFYESYAGEVAKFIRLYSPPDMKRKGDCFVFTAQDSLPDYSIKGNSFGGVVATETIEGYKGDILKENKIVFDILKGEHRPISSVLSRLDLYKSNDYYFTTGIINPGSIDSRSKKRISGYSLEFNMERNYYRYSEVTHV